MIVKIKIKSEGEIITMLFGNSYKRWDIQFREYCWLFKPIEVLEVETAKDKWKGWGGLKWCNENEFQNELNREGCQSSDLDNPKPRVYANMVFKSNKIAENIINKIARSFVSKAII